MIYSTDGAMFLLATTFPFEFSDFVIPIVGRKELLQTHLEGGYGKMHSWLTPNDGVWNVGKGHDGCLLGRSASLAKP